MAHPEMGLGLLRFLESLRERKAVGRPRARREEEGPSLAEQKFLYQQMKDIRTFAREEREEARAERGELRAEERLAFEKQKFVVQEERQRRQFRLTKWKEYLDGLPEGPSKDHARKLLQSDYEAMPPYEQQVLKPYFTRLLDPLQEKKAMFLRTVQQPKWHDYDPEKQPSLYASDLFAQDDYARSLNQFMGIATEAKKTIPLGENIWAYRSEDGKMGILSRESFAGSEAIQTVLDNNKTTLDMALANGGEIDTGVSKSVIDGRGRYEITPTYNILTGKKAFRKTEVGKVIQAGQRELPKELTDFGDGFATGSGNDKVTGGALYNKFKKYMDTVEDQLVAFKKPEWKEPRMVKPSELPAADQLRLMKRSIRKILGTRLQGFNVEIHNPGEFAEGMIYGSNYIEGPDQYITFVPGIPRLFSNDASDMSDAAGRRVHGVSFYYDEEYDSVYDTLGIRRGSLDEVTAKVAAVPKGGQLKW